MSERFRLYTSNASPYARKVRILLREKGLLANTDEIFTSVGDDPAELLAANPLAQIPAFVAGKGLMLSDSALIGQWLDAHFGEPKFYPSDPSYWQVRRLEVMANGILEMSVKLVLENRRPEAERSASWLKRWNDNLMRSLDTVEGQDFGEGLNMGTLTLAVAATYVDFRFPQLEWKTTHPKLAQLQTLYEARQSFIDTYPK
jgi:glutathione S-transferase